MGLGQEHLQLGKPCFDAEAADVIGDNGECWVWAVHCWLRCLVTVLLVCCCVRCVCVVLPVACGELVFFVFFMAGVLLAGAGALRLPMPLSALLCLGAYTFSSSSSSCSSSSSASCSSRSVPCSVSSVCSSCSSSWLSVSVCVIWANTGAGADRCSLLGGDLLLGAKWLYNVSVRVRSAPEWRLLLWVLVDVAVALLGTPLVACCCTEPIVPAFAIMLLNICIIIFIMSDSACICCCCCCC